MSIGRQEIMQVMEKRRSAAPTGDTATLWLIMGGWFVIVAILSCLTELQAWLSR